MKQPLFSITTPCFNSAPTIERTLRSVLEQDFPDYEYIIVDGGSTDGTVDIIKRYEPLFEGRMRWKSEPDNGIYDAFNKGIEQSKGVYCWNVNADDFMEKNALRTIANILSELKPSEYPVISGGSHYIYEDGRFAYDKKLTKEEGDRQYKLANIGINHPATLIPKNIYDKVGVYDSRYKIMGDMDWFRRAYEEGAHFLYIDDILTNMTEGGVSTKLNLCKLSKDRWLYSRKFYSSTFCQVKAFIKWLFIYLKGRLKYILVKKGIKKS